MWSNKICKIIGRQVAREHPRQHSSTSSHIAKCSSASIAFNMSLLTVSATVHRASTSNAILNSSQISQFRRQLFASSRLAMSAQSSSPVPHSRQYIMTSHDADVFRDCDTQRFHIYTSGRWLWSEKDQLARRYVEFDLAGLLQVSAQAIGARSFVQVKKVPEGNLGKVFLLTMDNGRELIANYRTQKLDNAGRPHLTAASEAATMDYVRNVLGVPAPRIYGWSSSTDNPVKAEYILMERSGGVKLGKVWHELSPEIAHALRFRETLHGQITGLASSIFSDGEPVLQGMLIRLQDEWSTCVGPSKPCPLSFTSEDRTQQQHLQSSWSEGVELMHEILTEIGAYQGWDGWVNRDNYSVYKERLARCREAFLNRYAKTEEERSQWIQAWPFEDKAHAPTYL